MNPNKERTVKVLIVDDSLVVRELLVDVFSADPQISVVGVSSSGEEAVESVRRLRPDVVTMDIHLPKMNGFDATRRIMETCPTPVVMVSGIANTQEKATTVQAARAGALAVLPKPSGPGMEENAGRTTDLVQAVKLMSEVKVLTRWPRTPRTTAGGENVAIRVSSPLTQKFEVLAIGASTGGPPVLQTILSRIPQNYAIPVLLVQHIATGFIDWFVEWLRQECSLNVQLACHGDYICAGNVYVAPDGAHMSVVSGGRLWLTKNDPEYGLRPSVSHLFRSVAQTYGKNAIGVLLSGMGKDGASELKMMKDRGAVTLVQDKESSVVHGMPGEAIRLGGANYVLSPDQIADAVVNLASQTERRWKS